MTNLDFLSDGGTMGRLIREKDWDETALGRPEQWPAPLKTMVRLMLTTQHPIFIFWGAKDLLCFYNDSYSRSFGPEKHPRALGAPGRDIFPEIWDIIGPQIDHVMAGRGATWHENHLVPTYRHGRRDEVYWTYSYSPIDDPGSPTGVGGVLVICTETTEQVLLERRRREESERAYVTLRETHHRVKNNLSIITAIVGLEQRGLKTPELKEPLERIRARIHSVAQLYEMMLTAGDNEAVDAGAYITRLCTKFGDIAMTDYGPEIECRVDAISASLSPDDAISLGAVAVELAGNAVKHAFAGRKAGVIDVRFFREGEDFVFTVADNGAGGAGSDGAGIASTGIGMELVKHYAQSLGGALETQTGDAGTRVKLRFPASRQAGR